MAKFVAPTPPPLTEILCRACGIKRAPEQYRVFCAKPLTHMDFCVDCEQREGTITLYRRYNAYGTEDIAKAVQSHTGRYLGDLLKPRRAAAE